MFRLVGRAAVGAAATSVPASPALSLAERCRPRRFCTGVDPERALDPVADGRSAPELPAAPRPRSPRLRSPPTFSRGLALPTVGLRGRLRQRTHVPQPAHGARASAFLREVSAGPPRDPVPGNPRSGLFRLARGPRGHHRSAFNIRGADTFAPAAARPRGTPSGLNLRAPQQGTARPARRISPRSCASGAGWRIFSSP